MKKNDVIASEINDENDIYSLLKLADIESICDQLMKTNSSNLEISSIDEVSSKLIDHNLV